MRTLRAPAVIQSTRRMSEAMSVQSPYMLPPGPERRASMLRMGIRPCPLDYTDDEWATIVANADATYTSDAPAENANR